MEHGSSQNRKCVECLLTYNPMFVSILLDLLAKDKFMSRYSLKYTAKSD